ncbi:MAG: SxtJ family membrane protein, partial [Gammaproteobacteria bacterium]
MSTPSTDELRRFGLITAAIVALLFGVVLPWLFDHALRLWPWIVAGVLSGWALVWPRTLFPIYRAWMAIGQVLGWINSRIILGLMFYVMIMP